MNPCRWSVTRRRDTHTRATANMLCPPSAMFNSPGHHQTPVSISIPAPNQRAEHIRPSVSIPKAPQSLGGVRARVAVCVCGVKLCAWRYARALG